MRTLAELLSDDPGWPVVQKWIAEATNHVVVLPAEPEQAGQTLYRLQVTSHSILGALALETGGILIDHGWLRLLGSGSPEFRSSLTSWEPLEWGIVVGHDAVGGFFALDREQQRVRYLAPDTLVWEVLELNYPAFVDWTFTADLDAFYEDLRWPGWRDELAGAGPDEGFLLLPPPFIAQGKPVANARRTLVPMAELWALQKNYARQVAALPEGTRIKIRVRE